MILLVEIHLAYLLSWFDPPPEPLPVSIRVAEYQARPLAVLSRLAETERGTGRREILKTLDALSRHPWQRPVIVHLAVAALRGGEGEVYLLASDSSPQEVRTWLRLRDVLARLKACPARQKLLILDLMPASIDRLGWPRDDVPAAIARELIQLPDADRWVLCSHAAGQTPQWCPEEGQSIFSYYCRQALHNQSYGMATASPGRFTASELAAFVEARVERWSRRQRGEAQTPTLLGNGPTTPIAFADAPALPRPPSQAYPDWLLDGWKARDAGYQAGLHRLAPRLFRQSQAALHAAEVLWLAGASDAQVRKRWFAECERLQEGLRRLEKELAPALPAAPFPQTAFSAGGKKTFDDVWTQLQQLPAGYRPAEAERAKTRLIDEVRGKLDEAELDAVVFAHALSDPRLDPAAVRLYDRILHPTSQTMPRTAEALRLRQLADLAGQLDAATWPRDVIETLLRAAEVTGRAIRQPPSLPGYLPLLTEPVQTEHDGEVRLWARGFASLDEAHHRLSTAGVQLDQLLKLNEQWRRDEVLLAEAQAELPAYIVTVEANPPLRRPWVQATTAANALADELGAAADRVGGAAEPTSWQDQIGRLSAHLAAAEPHAQALRQALHTLREPFASGEVGRLEKQCRSSHADSGTLRSAEALLTMRGPGLRAESRLAICQAALELSRRLHEETLALDRQPRGAPEPAVAALPLEEQTRRAVRRARDQMALCRLAGVSDDRLRPLEQHLQRCIKEQADASPWCDLAAQFRRLHGEQVRQQYLQESAWHRRARLAWLLPPLEHLAGIDDQALPIAAHCRDENQYRHHWLQEHHRSLAQDYHGLNLETPAILMARQFHHRAACEGRAPGDKHEDDPQVRMRLVGAIEPLGEKTPDTRVWLEVSRAVPAGHFGPLDLRVHRPDAAWLDVAPEAATIPELLTAREPRTVVHKVPLKVMRKSTGERSGLPPPLGFLVQARFEGRSYHHLVTTPIPADSREVQILVSADPKQPRGAVEEIRVRPGNIKHSYHLYVKNLMNRLNPVHVEVTTGETVLFRSREPIRLDPDDSHKLVFDDAAIKMPAVLEPLRVQVLSEDRKKVLASRSIRVAILAPQEYVSVGEVLYEPGEGGNNRWTAQVQTSRPVGGPAIAAELVLPVRRIRGLLGVGGGTLHVELPPQAGSPRILFAEKIRIASDGDQHGAVYLNVDGVPRAFVYPTRFLRTGGPLTLRKDDQPAVRLMAPHTIMAGVNYLVDVEVDNAPPGAKLEVALGRSLADGFKPEAVRDFGTPRKQEISLQTAGDALVLQASIQDWTATFDTRLFIGTRTLRARLLDGAGKEIAQSSQAVVIDETAPLARFQPVTGRARPGAVLPLQVQASDDESGISQVLFFLGRPDRGEVPPGAVRIKAAPANLNFTLWGAALPVPAEQKGPLTVSVQVVNGVGLASVDTITVPVQEGPAAKTGVGAIAGRVFEGPRPQPNLVVTLTDERGKEMMRALTQSDGTFRFEQLTPGVYRLICVKPESQRRATLEILVEPERTSKADLGLSL
jgi:hypothetical protein